MIMDAIRKATNDAGLYPWLILRPVRECVTWALLKILVLENVYKIVMPLFAAAYAAPNKDTTFL